MEVLVSPQRYPAPKSAVKSVGGRYGISVSRLPVFTSISGLTCECLPRVSLMPGRCRGLDHDFTVSPFPRPIWSRTAVLETRVIGTADTSPARSSDVLYQDRVRSQQEPALSPNLKAKLPRIPCNSDQPRYDPPPYIGSSYQNIDFHPAFAVFELPDELILSILSHVAPEPQPSDHRTRFRVQYGPTISDCNQERTRFLRPLSMTCKAMRLRLIPWIWGHLELFPERPQGWRSTKVRNLEIVLNVLEGDAYLAATVK